MKAIVNGKLVYPDRICDGVVLIDGDRIIASGDICVPENCEIIDASGLYVGPGLFDQHVHGYRQCGKSFTVEDDAREVAFAHLKHGTTQMTPSAAYSLSKEQFLHVIDQCNSAISDGNSSIVGIHFEGPFINPVHGANSHLAWEFSEENCEEIFKQAGKNVVHCTYAPEMPFGEQLESVLKKYGVVADIGHTRADPESVERAVRNGVKIVTHLYDAMGNYRGEQEAFHGTGDPQESVSDIVMSVPDLFYELICDSRYVHVRPVSIRQAYKNAGEDHIICISDATGGSGYLNDADYPPEDRRSAQDLNFNSLGQLSGSRLVLAQSVANFMKATGTDVRVGFKVGSTNSAKALGFYKDYGSIDPGKYANIVFVDREFCVKKVIFKGTELEIAQE